MEDRPSKIADLGSERQDLDHESSARTTLTSDQVYDYFFRPHDHELGLISDHPI